MPVSDSPVGPSVAQMFQHWSEPRRGGPEVAGSTLDGNESHFNNHIVPAFCDVAIPALVTIQQGRQIGS